ncbi:MAG TPA: HesA/MoeB/ThiF family protein [Cyclobacteriaceae bacterium]|nr:HesA/MoeB/ThiF family protein [Cyclobacteriaceae bacterium]
MINQERYLRQLQLPRFGEEGQKKLTGAKVLVIGAGGLGVPVLQYLTGMGVGNIGVMDEDVVSLSNLHRQVIYTPQDVGRSKVSCCVPRLQQLNPEITITGIPIALSKNNALEMVAGYDVVVDATDNFTARYLINDACVILNKPFIYGALQQFEGHVSVFNYQGGPTYRCLYPTPPSGGQIPDCNTAGVLGIVPGLVGSYQALETVKVITGIGKPLSGILQVFDFLDNSQYSMKLTAKEENRNIKFLREDTILSCNAEPSISVEELLSWMNEKKPFNLVDVRENHEFAKGHLEKAVPLPLSTINGKLPELSKNQPWVVICQQGGRSKKAVDILKEKDPSLQLFNLEGGLSDWTKRLGNKYLVT